MTPGWFFKPRRGYCFYAKTICAITILILLLHAYTFDSDTSSKTNDFFGKIYERSKNYVRESQWNNSTESVSSSDIGRKIVYPLTSVMSNPYLIESPNMCKGQTNLSFIVLVHSATNHTRRRVSIRETWANYKLFDNSSMRVVFVLGRPDDEETQNLIDHEQHLYNDIVEGDFVDSYHNLTLKAMLGVRWVTENCPLAKFVLKVDDDVFVNVFKLFEMLDTELKANATRHIYCHARLNGTSPIMREGKWSVGEHVYRNMTEWPFTHCNGFFMLYNGDMAPELYRTSKRTEFVWLDDVFVSGILAEKIGKVTHIDVEEVLSYYEEESIYCLESDLKNCRFLANTGDSNGIMERYWLRTLYQYKDLVDKRYDKITKDWVLK